jgi:diaminohydroxyphosphoribosylaminopyrimidine deaminase/5-amino-6-(5-phosphoribosylamino)uracil reductase
MQKFSDDDRSFMSTALELAASVKGSTLPNPAVGAVIAKNGHIVGKGATAAWGGPHAEKKALAAAGVKSRGATLYVTLEPCCHFGRTPPCTDAIIAAGISRVVVALRDPNPLVAGKGIEQLRRNGIPVATGLLRTGATSLNEDFIWAITRKRSFITLKLALTLDGRIADLQGNSKWITSPALRRVVHELRSQHAAVAVGNGTLIADDPRLTARTRRKTRPARIVFTSAASLPPESYFYRHAGESRSIVVVRKKAKQHIETAPETGIEYWYTGRADAAGSMTAFTEMAFKQNLTSIFIEGGQRIASVLLEAGLVNRLYLFYGNKIIGKGRNGILFRQGLSIGKCITLKERKSILVGSDMYVTGIPGMADSCT